MIKPSCVKNEGRGTVRARGREEGGEGGKGTRCVIPNLKCKREGEVERDIEHIPGTKYRWDGENILCH